MHKTRHKFDFIFIQFSNSLDCWMRASTARTLEVGVVYYRNGAFGVAINMVSDISIIAFSRQNIVDVKFANIDCVAF